MTAPDDNDDSRPRAASVFDVAKVAGVSHQTVSRVLNDHPSLRDATRQKVLAAMRELNYRPNAAARALSSSRSRMIGILSTSSGEYGPASSVAAVETAARARGYSVTIANADGLDPRSIDEAVNHLANLSAEGLVVVAPQTQVLVALSELSIGIPFVTLQAADSDAPGARQFDQVVGARLATAHLVALGHRRIGHIAGPSEWLDASQRLAGFREELAVHGLDAGVVETGDWSAASGYRAATELISRGVSAIFVGNDQMALGAVSAATAAYLDVPGDLSIVGFDDVPEAAFYRPPLTTVRQDLAEAGRRAVALLLGESDAAPSVHPELIVRASTAPPRSGHTALE
ncbi:LacI family DNA-binding transcriptional regulator [Cryobacterium sp. SO2]|uniref:LacI family DNA-binding transcriptional regulator n=1 Tax=Cryobacterium sp. SO2 TaxID=1897060 RepID=UPI00223DB9A3|nr:LacI family DNA-binding transcriptional regulator [Cryobacterium sp. SO2]WEO79216.1 LacI family DNA-binding transcriptional regulator [Cryobacterium sp. SO2]